MTRGHEFGWKMWSFFGTIVSFLILVVLSLVTPSNSEAFDEATVKAIEKETIQALEVHARKLSVQNFFNDLILTQTVSDSTVTYAYKDTQEVVHTTDKINDKYREVIVVGSDENAFAIPTKREGIRRQFIMLKKVEGQARKEKEGGGIDYYVSFVFLRSFQSNESKNEDMITIAGMQSIPEYDIWDKRTAKFYPGWNNCDFTAMFTCTSVQALKYDAKRKAKNGKRRRRRDLELQQEQNRFKRSNSVKPTELIPFQLPKGFDTRKLKDLYFEFDYHRFKIKMDEEEKQKQRKINEEIKQIAQETTVLESQEVEALKQAEKREFEDKQLEEDIARLQEEKKELDIEEFKLQGLNPQDEKDDTSGFPQGRSFDDEEGQQSQGNSTKDKKALKKILLIQIRRKKEKKKQREQEAQQGSQNQQNTTRVSKKKSNKSNRTPAQKKVKKEPEEEKKAKVKKGTEPEVAYDEPPEAEFSPDEGGHENTDGKEVEASGPGDHKSSAANEANAEENVEATDHRRRKRNVDKNRKTNQVKLDEILAASNQSKSKAYLYDPASGMSGAPGIKTIVLLGESKKELKKLLRGQAVEDGAIVVKTIPKRKDILKVLGSLFPNSDGNGYNWFPTKEDDVDLENQGGNELLGPGDSQVIVWDLIDFDKIDEGTERLYESGIGVMEAKLRLLGAQMTNIAPRMIRGGLTIDWRQGTDMLGTSLNGGPYMKQGLHGQDSFPENSEIGYGTMIHGAGENGQMFFFPWGSLTRATYKFKDIKLPGYYLPNVPGSAGGFFPDDAETAKEVYDERGKLIPQGFKPENDNLGIWGFLRQGYIWTTDVPKIKTLYDPTAPEWNFKGDEVWIPDSNDKPPTKPKRTRKGQKILYGRVFPGMLESPHVFIADGDSISGHFIPYDDNFPYLTESAHGVLTPSYFGEYAIFKADTLTEVEYYKEVRGVFTPDAMGYVGGVSGVLSRTDESPQKFVLHLDRPAVEFMFIDGYPDTKDVWSPYLKPGQFRWSLITGDEEDEDGGSKKSTAVARKQFKCSSEESEPELMDNSKKDDDDSDDFTASAYGTKVIGRKTDVFLPLGYVVKGVLILVPRDTETTLKIRTFDMEMVGNKPEAAFRVSIFEKGEEISQDTLNEYSGATAMIIPQKFPRGDAFTGKLNKKGTIKLAAPIRSHFLLPEQDIWVPVGFRERLKAGGGREENRDLADEAEREAKENYGGGTKKGKNSMPGVLIKPKKPPKKVANYKFGSLYDLKSDEMTEDFEDQNMLPHYYTFGYFLKSKGVTHPIFVPETGILGTFTPYDDIIEPIKVFYFPPKVNVTDRFVFQKSVAFAGVVKGEFRPNYKRPSSGYLKVKINQLAMTVDGTPDVVSGWKQVDYEKVTKEMLPDGWQKEIGEDRLVGTRRVLKYALVDLGGGFKGVVVQGAESIDDPNNPMFQPFLHYKAIRDGDVNPWGTVNVVDPIEREPLPKEEQVKEGEQGIFGGIVRLGQGHFARETGINGSMANNVMREFSTSHWEYKKTGEVFTQVKRKPLKLGGMGNVVNMLDFRMYLFKRYTLKKAKYNNAWARIYVPFGAEPFISFKQKAKPNEDWLEEMKNSGATSSLLHKSISMNFAAHFQLDIGDVMKFERPAGESVPNVVDEGESLTATNEWGDETNSDEIWLDPFQAAQITVSIQLGAGVSGMDIGFYLVSNIGHDGKYSKIAKRLLDIMEEKRRKKKSKDKKRKSSPTTTDLLGEDLEKEQTKPKESDEDEKSDEGGESEEVVQMGRSLMEDQGKKEDYAQVAHGWKTQFRLLKERVTSTEKDVYFYGLGNCKPNEILNIDDWNSGDPKKVIHYFMKMQRIDCMEHAGQKMINLVNEGYLEMDKEAKFFRIPIDQKASRNLRLTPAELKKLSIAFEFHSFTRTYYNIIQKNYLKDLVIQEPHCNISRSVAFLTEMSLYVITRAPLLIPAHAVRMIRNLLSTLRSTMTKLYQDGIILEECESCDFDVDVNKGDQFRITSLIQFIINGMEEYEVGKSKLRPSFNRFVSLNVDALKQRVVEFGRQFPRKPPVEHAPH